MGAAPVRLPSRGWRRHRRHDAQRRHGIKHAEQRKAGRILQVPECVERSVVEAVVSTAATMNTEDAYDGGTGYIVL